MARFTRADSLKRYAPSGRTNIECPGNKILAPESAFEKAFYPEGTFGIQGTCWLEYLSRHVAMGAKASSKERLLGETWGTTWSKDGNTSNPLPGWVTNFHGNETKHIRTQLSSILNLIKTKQRQAILHVI